jgi:hypothetical protein
MDRATLRRHLEQADRRCVAGEVVLTRQRLLVDRLRLDGHDTREAENLLKEFERIQGERFADRKRVRSEIAAEDSA